MPEENQNKNFQEQLQDQLYTEHPKDPKHFPLWVALLVLFLVGVAGVFAYNNLKSNFVEEKNELVDLTDDVVMKDSTDTSDWQTYRNEKYGYEFKYPAKYFLHAENANTDLSEGKPYLTLEKFAQKKEGGVLVRLVIYSNPNYLSTLDWLASESRGKASFFSITSEGKRGYEDYTSVKIDGFDGITINLSGGSREDAGTNADETTFSRGSYVFQFWGGYRDSEQDLKQQIDQILSTFKFINQYNTLNFGTCKPGDQLSSTSQFYDDLIEIRGSSNDQCLVDVIRDTEGGKRIYDCVVPKSLGFVEFNQAYFGPIFSYCTWTNPEDSP